MSSKPPLTHLKLYKNGARNFLVLDVPPIDRSPEAAIKGKAQLWKKNVIIFNTHVSNMITALANKYPDATFFRMGINGRFSNVLDNVSYSVPTKVYKDTTELCAAYANAQSHGDTLPSKDYKSPRCRYAVNEYFRLFSYHPTYPMHHTMAIEVADGLAKL